MSATILLGATLAWFGFHHSAPTELSIAPVGKPATPPPTAIKSDHVRIFQTAFWRSPTANDRILHAERREWSDKDGLRKWQWFLVVQPSPELVKYLRDDNAFGLSKATSTPPIAEAPEWFTFPSSDLEVLGSRAANLRLIFSKTDQRLYATSSGDGFRPGATAAAKPASTPATNLTVKGRLPTTSPPNQGLE